MTAARGSRRDQMVIGAQAPGVRCPICEAGPHEPCTRIIHPLREEPGLLPHHHVRYWLALRARRQERRGGRR